MIFVLSWVIAYIIIGIASRNVFRNTKNFLRNIYVSFPFPFYETLPSNNRICKTLNQKTIYWHTQLGYKSRGQFPKFFYLQDLHSAHLKENRTYNPIIDPLFQYNLRCAGEGEQFSNLNENITGRTLRLLSLRQRLSQLVYVRIGAVVRRSFYPLS